MIVRVLRECAPGERAAAAVAEGAKQTRFTHTNTVIAVKREHSEKRARSHAETETGRD